MNKIKRYKELEIYLQNSDYVDIKTIEGKRSLRYFISAMLSYYPWWIVSLYRIREIIVKVLDLKRHEKPDVPPSIKPEDLAFDPGEKASFFTVRTAEENTYWVSETPEDKHLKAYFGVVTEELGNCATRFHVFTSVKYIHWTGPVYFNLIRPFHHLVLWNMMKYAVKAAGRGR